MVVSNGVNVKGYRDNVLIGTAAYTFGVTVTQTIKSHWRSSNAGRTPLTDDVEKGAYYNIALTSAQRQALHDSMLGAISASKSLSYPGSWRAFPVITITGPITDPVLTNASLGEKLDLTGVTIAAEEYYVIDCRYGYKTVTDHVLDNKIADLTDDSDLATFRIAPDPEVPGGVNVFSLTGTSTTSATQVDIDYHEQYLGL